jgi:hypothetical protein
LVFFAGEEGAALLAVSWFFGGFGGLGVGGLFADGKGSVGYAGVGGSEGRVFDAEGFEGCDPQFSQLGLLFRGEVADVAWGYGHFRVGGVGWKCCD